MKIETKPFRVSAGEAVDLKARPTAAKPLYRSKEDYQGRLAEHLAGLQEQQTLLYASGRHALLLILQGMDTAGKDGIINHVLSGVNPEGCEVFSFKQPSEEEQKHDFLWRTTCRLPERGRIGIFNRSYYEEVLIVRVHPDLLLREGLPEDPMAPETLWKERYQSILDLERHLHRNGTAVVKVFLHVSREEQGRRLLERIDRPEKNWKFNTADIKERALWKEYRQAYEACLGATSTDHAPWFVVPADDKKNARLIVAKLLLDTLKDLDLRPPATDGPRRLELEAMRKLLGAEGG